MATMLSGKPSKLTTLAWRLVYNSGLILSASYSRDCWNSLMSNL